MNERKRNFIGKRGREILACNNNKRLYKIENGHKHRTDKLAKRNCTHSQVTQSIYTNSLLVSIPISFATFAHTATITIISIFINKHFVVRARYVSVTFGKMEQKKSVLLLFDSNLEIIHDDDVNDFEKKLNEKHLTHTHTQRNCLKAESDRIYWTIASANNERQ